MDYTVTDLIELLQVLNKMSESGKQVNHEINSVLSLLMTGFGVSPVTSMEISKGGIKITGREIKLN